MHALEGLLIEDYVLVQLTIYNGCIIIVFLCKAQVLSYTLNNFTCSQASHRSIKLSFSTFMACIFFLMASIVSLLRTILQIQDISKAYLNDELGLVTVERIISSIYCRESYNCSDIAELRNTSQFTILRMKNFVRLQYKQPRTLYRLLHNKISNNFYAGMQEWTWNQFVTDRKRT